MTKERSQQSLLSLNSAQRPPNGSSQLCQILRQEVGQVAILAMVPDALHRVEVRGIRRQPFHVHASPKTPPQPTLSRSMHLPAVHNQNDASPEMPQQACHKQLKIPGPDISGLQVEVKTESMANWRDADGRDSRKSVVSSPTIQKRCLCSRRPGAAYQRLQHKAGFIGKNDATTSSAGFFLYVANPAFANARWPFRCVGGPVFPVSGSSSPSLSAGARRQMGRNLRQTGGGLPGRSAAVSTVRLDSPGALAQPTADGLRPVAAFATVWDAGRDVAWQPTLASRRFGRFFATESPPPRSHQPFGRLGWAWSRPATMRWHVGDGVPALVLFLWVSCI